MFKSIVSMVILVIACTVSGCYQTVNMSDMESANKICSEYSSLVVEIYARMDGTEKVLCSNLDEYYIQSTNLPKEQEKK